LPGAILKLQNGISKETLLKLNGIIEDSMYFADENMLYFKLDQKAVTIMEKVIYLTEILDEPGVKVSMERIKVFFDKLEKSPE
jgi:hypothetical protein